MAEVCRSTLYLLCFFCSSRTTKLVTCGQTRAACACSWLTNACTPSSPGSPNGPVPCQRQQQKTYIQAVWQWHSAELVQDTLHHLIAVHVHAAEPCADMIMSTSLVMLAQSAAYACACRPLAGGRCEPNPNPDQASHSQQHQAGRRPSKEM